MLNHRITPHIADVLLCVITGIFFYKIATWHIEFALYNGEYTPAFPDSFYHARRILDSVANGGLIQFDPHFHAPEGAWITWPWGYDWLLARIINLGVFFTGMNPLKIMVYIPPVWGIVNLTLLVILGKVLNISFHYRVVIAFCFILFPLNQQLHLIGRVDHHFMEQTMVLLCAILTLKWFQLPESRFYAIASGGLLSGAMAIHNGLFVLQFPIIVGLLSCWLLSAQIPKTTIYFSISLFFSTLLFLLPSETFQEGFFSFYYHSFFHLYISFCVSLLAYLLFFLELTKKNICIVSLSIVFMILPLINIFLSGYGFVSGDWDYLSSMGEVKSFFAFNPSQRIGIHESIRNYSAYILLLPVTLGYVFYLACKKPDAERIFFALFCLMSVFFLLKQMRFHHFGSFILYVPVALMFQNILPSVGKRRLRALGFALLTLLMYGLPVGTLFKKQPGSPVFESTYWVSQELRKHCENDPGIILASPRVGHYLTYFTRCSVLANSFIMAPKDFEYLKKTELLFSMDAQQLHSLEKDIKYVFLFREDNLNIDLTKEEVNSINSSLSKDLLLSDNLPGGFKTLYQVKQRISGRETVFARAVKVIR